MRKIILLAVVSSFASLAFGQSYPGYNSGNFTGVNGVFFNPSNIADSRYRWDVNILGVHGGVANNSVSFGIKDLSGDEFENKLDTALFGKNAKPLSILANADVFGPSFMFNVGKKTGIAITSRVRTMVNVSDFDGKLIGSIEEKLDDDFPINLGSDQNQRVKFNTWGEFGVSVARVLYQQDKHFLKGGVSVKYLAGAANSYLNISKFSGTANEDGFGTYITNATGKISAGISGVDPENFELSDMTKFNSTGVGVDVGFNYEYRPNATGSGLNSNLSRYKFKLGVSLLDLGKIKYTADPNRSAGYSVNIPNGNKWYPKDLEDKSFDEAKDYLDANPYFTSAAATTGDYKVALPSSFVINADYNIHRGFYIGALAYLNAAKPDDNFGSYYYNSITLTPRYEGKSFGLYLPINHNALSKTNIGVSLRLGPVFIGSGSIISSLMNNAKQADFHFGIRLGSLKKQVKEDVITKTTVVEKTVVVKKKAIKEETQPVVKQEEAKAQITAPAEAKDSDGDGILDDADKCPTISGLAKYEGCPIPDSDGDGINDEMDSCKTVVGLLKYNGCPIPDTDGDGVNDELDKCVTVAGLERYAGCPIPDTDGDGVNDEVDKCLTVAGSKSYAGCPIPDTDGDGLNDEEDKCPTLKGSKANYGCPEIKKEAIKTVSVAAKGIQFQTGKSVILPKSFTQLNGVAKILKDNPTYHLKIDGHTDNVGDADKNLTLSSERAQATKDYLVKKGVDESRIETEGFGSAKPIAPNTTAAGKLKNRRVEITITY